MAAPTFFFCLVLVLFQGVIGDAPLSGEPLYSFQTFGGFISEPPSMWGAIPQTTAQEWTNLRDIFTIETWFYWEGPLTNPLDYDLEHEYKPILTRHPAGGAHNAWAHFHLELQYFPDRGAAVLAFSGCGCDGPLPQPGGPYPDHCDLGYVLRSDQGIRGPITYLHPKQWHHLAYVVDGDGSNSMTTQTASLIVDGVLLDNISWPLTHNCKNRAIPWQTPQNSGLMNEITVGYLHNDDVSPQGTNGRVDEVRIWNIARSPTEVKQTYMESLSGEEEGLLAYYTFNEGPQAGVQIFRNKVPLSKTVCGEPVGSPRPLDTNRNVWASSSGLALTSIVEVQSTLLDEEMMPVRFELFGLELTDSPIDFYLSEVSPALRELVNMGQAVIYDPRTGVNINVNSLPQNVFRVLEISVACVPTRKGDCSNIDGDLYIQYYGVAPRVPGPSTRVEFDVIAACDAELDACGVCGGDNSSCQCTSYHQFGVNRMAYSLFNFAASQMLPLIFMIDDTINSSAAIQPGNANLEEQVTNLYETGNFHTGCLAEFSCLLKELSSQLMSLSVKSEDYTERRRHEFD